MTKPQFKGKYRVESTRLPNRDYAANGWYFVTICTQNRTHFFGDVINVDPRNFADLQQPSNGASVPPSNITSVPPYTQPTDQSNKFAPLKPGSLQAIVHACKSSVTRWCHKNRFVDFAWQPRFYEHIIRADGSLDRIRQYIINNPSNWVDDREKPAKLYFSI